MATKCHLLTLPNELLETIFEVCYNDGHRREVGKLRTLCRRLQSILESIFYRSIVVRTATSVKGLRAAFEHRSLRSKAVKSLKIIPQAQEKGPDIKTVPLLFPDLTFLKELVVESPCRVDSDSEQERFWGEWWLMFQETFRLMASSEPTFKICHIDPQDGRRFQHLRSCKLNFQGLYGEDRDFTWRLGAMSAVFDHPAMESLTLVSARMIDDETYAWDAGRPSTALKYLHLDHCLVDMDSLRTILKKPTALETLKIETCCNSTVSLDTNEFDNVLSIQAGSLKYLRLRTPQGLIRDDMTLDLHSLTHLETLEVERDNEASLMAEQTEMNLVPPPNLSHLIVTNAYQGTGNMVHGLLLLLHLLLEEFSPPPNIPRLKHLAFVSCPGACLREEMYHKGFEVLGKKMRERGVQLQFRRLTKIRDAVPPYFYDDFIPEEVVIYDNSSTEELWGAMTEDESREKQEIEKAERVHRNIVTPDGSEQEGDAEDLHDVFLGQLAHS